MQIKAARTPRETFELLRFFNQDEGLDGIIRRLDFTGAGPHQILFSTLGRLPELAELEAARDGYDPAQAFKAALEGDEFQNRIMPLVLSAYSEKRRLIFVHVPKCGGTDLTAILSDQYPNIRCQLAQAGPWARDNLYTGLRRLVETIPYADSIFVHGHEKLNRYLTDGIIRYGDRVFAVLRDPEEMVLSKVNYIFTRFARDPSFTAADTRLWARHLDRDAVMAAMSEGRVAPVANQIVTVPNLIPKNEMCNFLGKRDSASTLEMCARADIELTTMANYERWLAERWQVPRSGRKNASLKLMKLEEFGADERAYIAEITDEDRRLYAAVSERLEAAGTASIQGSSLI